MADINIVVTDEDIEGSHKEDGGSSDDPDEENWMDMEESLPPLARLEKYALSKKTYTRQMVGRVLLQVIRESSSDAIVPDIPALMSLVELTAADKEAMVRTELVEAIPHLALVCMDSDVPEIKDVVSKHFLSVVVDCLVDKEAQVRKIALAALLVLMEHGLVYRTDIEKKVCPSVLQLSYGPVEEEFLTGTIAFMSKLAPLLGRDTTEKMFLKRFSELCTNACFNVRKVCAASIGDFCAVVGPEAVEQIILPQFVQLCDDQMWNVRKACAEIVIALSCACTSQMRYTVLAPAFAKLLEDVSKCVRLAAYQILGPFISTFANPRIFGLAYSETGELVIVNSEGMEFRLSLPALNCSSFRGVQGPSLLDQLSPDLPLPKLITEARTFLDNLNKEETDQNSTLPNACSQTNTDENKPEPSSSDASNLNRGEEDLTAGGDDYFVISSPVSQTQVECSDINCDNNEGDFQTENLKTSSTDESTPSQIPTATPINSTALETDHNDSTNISKRKCKQKNKRRKWKMSKTCEKFYQKETSNQVNAQNMNEEINSNVNRDDADLKVVTKDISNLNLNSDNSEAINNNNAANQGKCNETTTPADRGCPSSETLSNLNVDNSIEIYTETENKANSAVIQCKDFYNIDEKSVIKSLITTYCNDINVNNEDCETIDKDFEKFNLYQYWYISPELPLDMSIVEAGKVNQTASSSSSTSTSQKENCDSQKVSTPRKKLEANILEKFFSEVLLDGETDDVGASKVSLSSSMSSQEGEPNIHFDHFRNVSNLSQEIVPRLLVNHYLSMTDPEIVNMNDPELSYHCAFSFPAVALTLGRDYWPVLCQTYRELAANMRWRVRRSIAGSLHELAAILGEKLATEHLVPIFDEISRDVDEVRIGILKHVVDFIKLIEPHQRTYCLTRLADYLQSDSEVNWRFRCESARQLLLSIPLWSIRNMTLYIVPLALNLLKDRVAAVRETSISLMSQIIQHLQPDPVSSSRLLADLAEQFAHSTRWVRRQTFAALCEQLTYFVLPSDIFARDILIHLLDLSWDPVPNVRLTVARTLSRIITDRSYFQAHTAHYQETSMVLRRLQTDKDRDVRQVAGA